MVGVHDRRRRFSKGLVQRLGRVRTGLDIGRFLLREAVHGRRRRDRTDENGDARDEQLRESKRPWSSSFALIDDTAFDGVVRVHRRGCVEE